jgi:hypothetical protein
MAEKNIFAVSFAKKQGITSMAHYMLIARHKI